MILIGESLNVISKKIGKAYKERDPKPIREEALFQRSKGMDYIDINLGPAKKEGELMPWVVKTVQEVVSDVPWPWTPPTSTPSRRRSRWYKPTAQPPLINSIMVRPERYQRMVPIAKDANADFIALMWARRAAAGRERARGPVRGVLLRQ
jgi:5-methyltetrahydrofolate corrinoid/iron sulfur protein methyltransferase